MRVWKNLKKILNIQNNSIWQLKVKMCRNNWVLSCLLSLLKEDLLKSVIGNIDESSIFSSHFFSALCSQKFLLNQKWKHNFHKLSFQFKQKEDKVKILRWDTNGFWLYYKRLEKQKFKWPMNMDKTKVVITRKQLTWLLDGLNLVQKEAHRKVNASIVI